MLCATSSESKPRRCCTHIARHRAEPRKPPDFRGFLGARYWDRTSDLFRVREARYRCANRACEGCSLVMRGGDGIRTRVNGFAGRCLAARPRHRVWFDPRVVIASKNDPRTRADDETRTRDPHLGKVMRYQLRYIRISFPVFPGHLKDSSRFRAARKTTLPPRVSHVSVRSVPRNQVRSVLGPRGSSAPGSRAIGAAGSALPSHGRGRGFKSRIAHRMQEGLTAMRGGPLALSVVRVRPGPARRRALRAGPPRRVVHSR